MKIINLVRWVIRITLFILILVLIFNNMQDITFNLFGIYHPTIPLIILTIGLLGFGVLTGLIIGTMKSFKLKAKIKMLEKELKKTIGIKDSQE